MYKDALLYGTAVDFDVPNIQKLLTIPNPEYVAKARFGSMEWGEMPEKHLCLLEETEEGVFCLPRNMYQHAPDFFHNKRIRNRNQLGEEPNVDYMFKGTLRDYQNSFVKAIDFANEDDLTLVMPCGTGKTIMGAYTTIVRNYRTIVLVPTRAIALQWKETFDNFTNLGASTFIAYPEKLTKLDLNQCEVLIISFDLFSERLDQFSNDFFNHWGHVILDEAHRVAAPTYQPILSKVNCRYRTALTATFRRADGMHNILIYHFGKMYTLKYTAQKADLFPLTTNATCSYLFSTKKLYGGKKNLEKHLEWLLKYFEKEGVFYQYVTNDIIEFDLVLSLTTIDGWLGKVNRNKVTAEEEKYYLTINKILQGLKKLNESGTMALVDTVFAQNVKRNRVLLSSTKQCINQGRCVLFLSKRKDVLLRYHEMFTRLGYKSGLLVSETQKKEDYMKYVRDEAQVIWGIYQIAKEGLDISRLDTLILHHPLKDAEQPIGRITREFWGKKTPLVIYPFDGYRPYQMMFHKMKSICKEKIVLKPHTNPKQLKQYLKQK